MDRFLRTFVGIRLGSPARAALAREAARLAELESDLRSPHERDLHLTVQFLGRTPQDDVHRISRALEEALGGFGPVPVTWQGLGAFPEPARARVVFAGVDPAGAATLRRLAAAVGGTLGALGYPPERRQHHPHVTLGRLRRRPDARLVAHVEGAADRVFADEILSEAKLILSDPQSRPYHYIDLTTVRFG